MTTTYHNNISWLQLNLTNLCSGVEKRILKETNHLYYMANMDTTKPN